MQSIHEQPIGKARLLSTRSLFFFLSSLCSLCLCGSISAAPDQESSKPYKLTVVLRVVDHPLLTKVFKDQLARELRDSLQDSLGNNLVEVRVVSDHPLVEQIDKLGLRKALESYKSSEPIKTHVVCLDYVDGQYQIQAAQHDGFTGMISPVIRVSRLDDPSGRPLVARTAALLAERDFGLVGTVIGDTKSPHKIQVALKGGRLAPLDRWVNKDDVFAVVQVARSGSSERVRDALLQVIEPPGKDGICICRLFARHSASDPASRLVDVPGMQGYRCVQLGTAYGLLRLRLIDNQGLPHHNLQIKSSHSSLDQPNDKLSPLGTTDRQGFLQSRDKFNHIALLVVQKGETTVARIPVPIFDDHVAVRTLVLDKNSTKKDELLALRGRYLRRLDDSRQVQGELAKTLSELLAKKDHEAAKAEAKEALERLRKELGDSQAELNNLMIESKNADFLKEEEKKSLLEDGGRRKQLEDAVAQLEMFIAARTKSIEQGEKARERDALVARARIHRTKAEYTEALGLYADALNKYGKTPELEKEANELAEGWLLKNKDAHPDARRYIYNNWPELKSAEQIKENIEYARRHFKECERVGDKLTPRKLLLVGIDHVRLLEQELSRLRKDRQDERAKAEALKAVAEGLRQLLDEVNKYVNAK
jgi:hypothetical protein